MKQEDFNAHERWMLREKSIRNQKILLLEVEEVGGGSDAPILEC